MSHFFRPVTRPSRSVLMALALSLATTGLMAQSISLEDNQPQLHLPRSSVVLGDKTIQVQTAQSPLETQKGLMFRANMGGDDGMLFDFKDSDSRCFWMRNTLLPLSAAFISPEGRILNIADMQALSEKNHCSKGKARYVLEMHQGWFAKNAIKAGMKVQITLPKP